MPATERLMVVLTIDEFQQGQRVPEEYPHLTIYPWFDLPAENWERFDRGMRIVIEETRQPTVMGGRRVMYGPDETMPARRLDRPTRTFNAITGFDLHAGVYGLAHRLGKPADDTYTGLNWNPHISDTPDRQVKEGEEVVLDNVTVISKDLERAIKIVKFIYRWNQSSE